MDTITPRLVTTELPLKVFAAPYFTEVNVSDTLGPAIEDYLNANLPILLPPYIDPAAEAAVRNIGLLRAGDTATGAIMTQRLLPTIDAEFVPKVYVDTVVAGVPQFPEAPAGPPVYGRNAGNWVSVLPLSGGTVDPGALVITNAANNAPGVSITPLGMFDQAPPPVPNAWVSNLTSYVNTATAGGHFGDATTSALFGATTIYGAPNNNYFGVTGLLNDTGTGGTGLHCALVGYATRQNAAPQPTTTVTATLAAPAFNVQVADVTNLQVPYPMPIVIGANGYYQIGVSGTAGPGTITCSTLVSVADATAGNTVTGNNNGQIWGANIYSRDFSGTSSRETNAHIGIELDLLCNSDDNAGYNYYGSPIGTRQILILIGGQADEGGLPAEIGNALTIRGGANTTFKRTIQVSQNTAYSQAAFDTRDAVQLSGANTIWLGDGHSIAFDPSGDLTLSRLGGSLTAASQANDPLLLLTPAANFCRLRWQGARAYTAGVWPDGRWILNDETAPGARLLVDTTGNVTVAEALTVGAALAVGAATTVAGTLTINDPATATAGSLTVAATASVEGAGVALLGNGAVTPNKYLRAVNGTFQIVDSAYAAAIFSLSDAGVATFYGDLLAPASLGLWGETPPTARPAVTGSRGTDTVGVLTQLLAALHSYGIISDATTP